MRQEGQYEESGRQGQLVLTSEPLYTERLVRAMVEEMIHAEYMEVGEGNQLVEIAAKHGLRVTDRSGTPQRGTSEEYSGKRDPACI